MRRSQNTTITVTNKSVYGRDSKNNELNIPIDSIITVNKVNNGVGFSTSSGNYLFVNLKNSKEIYDVISGLLEQRQRKDKEPLAEKSTQQSAADELKKFKELLDSGIITQEEFEAKKKQLLGL